MGLLDNLKDKAEELGERAKDGLDAARGRASGRVEDVKDRMGPDGHAAENGPTLGSASGDRRSARDAYDEVLEAAEQKAAARLAGPRP